ncbi:hypothetical protein BKA83DRAFT_4121001 [Pisolithus microcarpus]|nr:hypothetical protein BKA83DRAFT_4121001 [Pisolithus microcarpus]
MPPMTRGMACKGIRHYAPYNLHSRGPDQTLLDLSTPPFTLRTPVHLRNTVGARGVVPPPPCIHTAEGNPVANGVVVGFGVKTRFIQDCFELVKAIGKEQKKILQALEANEIISQERLEMVGQCTVEYIEECMEIAIGTLANEIEKYGFSMIDKD